MPCDHLERLRADAEALLAQADALDRDPRTRRNSEVSRAHAMSLALAMGHLRHTQQPEHAMTDQLTTVTPDIDRDRYGRPMIVPPGGGKKVAYRRCTSFVGVLEDMYNLQRWQMRNVALGLAERPDLLLSVAAHRDDKEKLNKLCEDAAEAAKAHAAATTGTAVHALTEIIDRGLDLPVIPDGAAADLEAYRKATAGIEWLAIEQGIVVDDLKVHGTPDRIGRLPDGRVVVLDLKTGSVDFGMGKIAMQMAMYAHGQRYSHTAGARDDYLERIGVSHDTAIVIHLPAGSGRCELLEVDIAAGWQGVAIASQVWEWRSRKGLAKPHGRGFDLPGLISLAATPDDLRRLYADHEAEWSDELTALAKARIDSLAASAA